MIPNQTVLINRNILFSLIFNRGKECPSNISQTVVLCISSIDLFSVGIKIIKSVNKNRLSQWRTLCDIHSCFNHIK